MDYGDDCLNETIKMFNNAQIFGVRTWEKAYSPIIVEQNWKNRSMLLHQTS